MRCFVLAGLLAWGSGVLAGQPALRFKVAPVGEDSIAEARGRAAGIDAGAGRRHLVVQFAEGPAFETLAALSARGAAVVAAVPDHAVLVSVEGRLDLTGLDATYAAPLAAEQKLSPLIDGASGTFVVEFHPDVEIADARRIVLDTRVELRDHPDLAPHQLLVAVRGRGRASDPLARLAARDEVAYIFPASPELISGQPVEACAGAITEFGGVGQYIASVGNGWDGAGLNAATLGFVFGAASTKVPLSQAQAEILRAMQEWSRAAAISWQPGSARTAARTVHILFGRLSHGDNHPFDGRGRVLAHTFYPSPPNPEPIAGDMHFDDDEAWRIGANMDVFSVALHELGHALGLAHSDSPGSVMYPYYRLVTALSAEDVAAIQRMYAGPSAEPPAPPVPPSNPSPPSNPAPPTNPAPPAPPSAPEPPANPIPGDTTVPALTVASPAGTTYLTSAPSKLFTGTASDPSGIASVTWSTNLGASGTATGTANWQADIPLLRGNNTVTIRATDGAGNVAWRSVVVIRR